MIHKIYAITVIILASCFPCSVLAFKNKQNFMCGVNQSACRLAYNFCQDKTINKYICETGRFRLLGKIWEKFLQVI